MAKEFFKEHNVTYTDKNVASDMEAQQEMIKKTGQMGVPVIDIDGTIVIGYNPDRLSQLLGIGGSAAPKTA